MSTEASSSSPPLLPATTAPSGSLAAQPSPSSVPIDEDVEKLLNREASAIQRDIEIERILKAFKLNPYDILDLAADVTPEGVKKRYRQLSLFIHPDKCPHPRAPEAFDILKKAESDLSDATKREQLDAVINQARGQILKSLSLPLSTPPDDRRLKEHALHPAAFKERLRKDSKDLLIDEEVRRRKAIKMNLANEGLEARKKEEEIESRKRKAEEDKAWEENREGRVESWRTFATNSRKKKKAKVSVLG